MCVCVCERELVCVCVLLSVHMYVCLPVCSHQGFFFQLLADHVVQCTAIRLKESNYCSVLPAFRRIKMNSTYS